MAGFGRARRQGRRSAQMSNAPTEARRAERRSKILVIVLVGIFFSGMFGFAIAVLDAGGEEAPTAPPPPSLPATLPLAEPTDEAIAPRILLALAEISPEPLPVDLAARCRRALRGGAGACPHDRVRHACRARGALLVES